MSARFALPHQLVVFLVVYLSGELHRNYTLRYNISRVFYLYGQFYEFHQNEFITGTPGSISMDSVGYVYVPSGCVSGENG